MTLDGVRSCCLGVEQDRPYVAGHVINKEEEVAPSSRCSQCHGAAEVTVYDLQLLLGVKAHLAGKGEPSLLSEDTGVTELLHMVDAWHAPHHLLVVEQL